MVDITPPQNRGRRTGVVQRPAFLEETGLDLTDRNSPEVQELVTMIGGGEPVEEIDVQSNSLDESDQIEAAILALRNEPPPAPARDDHEADAAVAQILRSTARGGNEGNKLSVVASIRAQQEAEDADDEDDDKPSGLDLREKSDAEIAAIGKLAPSAKQAIEANQGQHVTRNKDKPRPQSSSTRSAAKLYPDAPPKPVSKEPIRTEPEEPDEEPEEPEAQWPDAPKLTPENPHQPPPQIVYVPAKPQTGGGHPSPPLPHPPPPQVPPPPRPQVSAERKLAREAGVKTEAKVESQHRPTETLQSLLDQIEADEEPEPEEPQPAPSPPAITMAAPADKLLFTTVILKFERTLIQTYGGTRVEIWASGKITVTGRPTGPQLRAMILNELNLRDE